MIVNTKTGCLASGTLIKAAEMRAAGQSNVTKLVLRYGYDEPQTTNDRRSGKLLDVDCWNDLAGAAEGLEKGDAVMVTGEIQQREYNGKTYTSLRAETLYFDARTVMQLTNGLAAAVQQLQQQVDGMSTGRTPAAVTAPVPAPSADPAPAPVPTFSGGAGEMYPGEKLSDYAAKPQPAAPAPADALSAPIDDTADDLPF